MAEDNAEDPGDRGRPLEQEAGWFPKLGREERVDLSERIRDGAEGGVDFLVMMVLASTLASLGLLQGSTAVVIGAMLVAPLMGPLIGAGLALVQGNLKLFRSAEARLGRSEPIRHAENAKNTGSKFRMSVSVTPWLLCW